MTYDYELEETANDETVKLHSAVTNEIDDVLREAEKEKEMVGRILLKEGGERDLLELGRHVGRDTQVSGVDDTQDRIEKLEKLINSLEEKKKELSLNSKKSSKKKKKKSKSKTKSTAELLPTNTTSDIETNKTVLRKRCIADLTLRRLIFIAVKEQSL